MSDNSPKNAGPDKRAFALLPMGIALVTVGITVSNENRPLKYLIFGVAILILLTSMVLMIRSAKSGSPDQ